MTDRATMQSIITALHEHRIAGELDRLCALFASDASFRIAGTSDGKPVAISARGAADIRSWLSMLVKTFKLSGYRLLSSVIESNRAAVHWRVDIHSKVTGGVVGTELVDLIEVCDGRIASYVEFFVPC